MPSIFRQVAFFPDVEFLPGNPYWTLLKASLESQGVEFAPFKQRTFGRRWLWSNRKRVSVIHLHYVQQFYAYQNDRARLRWVLRFITYLILARLLGYRLIFTLHNLRATYPLRPEWIDYLGHWVAVNLANRVIVHCEEARHSLANYYHRGRNVFVIPHPNYIGIYPNNVSPEAARSHLGIRDHESVFLFLGGIRPNKGIETLISSFCKLPGGNLRLLIAGKQWPPPQYLNQLQILALQDQRVEFYPQFIHDEEIQIFFNAADVVVLPFTQILTSGSALLAMSFRKPVVVPAIGCLPELFTPQAGLIYDPNDPEGLLKALQLCLEIDLKLMGEAAFARAASFSWAEFARQTLAIYSS